MISHTRNNIKLGVFVLAGLALTITGFYLIGKNRSLFGSNFELKARFSNLNGLMKGNNVLYSGIQAGTVKSIRIVNDTTIQISMLIDEDLKPFIHKNALVSIGTEGLMGNKVVQITPGQGKAIAVVPGDILNARKSIIIDEMFQTLARTNENILHISEVLKVAVMQVNNSEIWKLLEDKETAVQLRSTLTNINKASIAANKIAMGINDIVDRTREGKGGAGTILTDTAFASELKNVMTKLSLSGNQAERLTGQLGNMIKTLNSDINTGPGLLNSLLKDTLMMKTLHSSFINIEKGTDGFNQNMEALKHSFLLRGYFRKLEKEKKKVNQNAPVH